MDTNIAPNYIRENFDREDRLAIVIIRRADDARAIEQRLEPAEKVVSDKYMKWLRYMNATGHDVYLGMNTIRPDAHGRTKRDIAEVKHVYLDFDDGGREKLATMWERVGIPKPNYVIESSRGRFQAIWKVEGFVPDQAETLMRGMVREFGADPAATDVSRVMRLPGFFNHKRETPHFVTAQNITETVWKLADFPVYKAEEVARQYQFGTKTPRPAGAAISQSERDWAQVNRDLAMGRNPVDVIRELAAQRADKPNPQYYAERTVTRAQQGIKRNNQGMSI